MIAHLDGNVITRCDSCFRVKRTGETDWTQDAYGVPASSGVPMGPRPDSPQQAAVTIPSQPVDYCPSCQDEREEKPNVLRNYLTRSDAEMADRELFARLRRWAPSAGQIDVWWDPDRAKQIVRLDGATSEDAKNVEDHLGLLIAWGGHFEVRVSDAS